MHNRKAQLEKTHKNDAHKGHDSPTLGKMAESSVNLLTQVTQIGKDTGASKTDVRIPIITANGGLHTPTSPSSVNVKKSYSPSILIRKILPLKRSGGESGLKASSQSGLDTLGGRNTTGDNRGFMQRRLSKSHSELTTGNAVTQKDQNNVVKSSPQQRNTSSVTSPCEHVLCQQPKRSVHQGRVRHNQNDIESDVKESTNKDKSWRSERTDSPVVVVIDSSGQSDSKRQVPRIDVESFYRSSTNKSPSRSTRDNLPKQSSQNTNVPRSNSSISNDSHGELKGNHNDRRVPVETPSGGESCHGNKIVKDEKLTAMENERLIIVKYHLRTCLICNPSPTQ